MKKEKGNLQITVRPNFYLPIKVEVRTVKDIFYQKSKIGTANTANKETNTICFIIMTKMPSLQWHFLIILKHTFFQPVVQRKSINRHLRANTNVRHEQGLCHCSDHPLHEFCFRRPTQLLGSSMISDLKMTSPRSMSEAA